MKNFRRIETTKQSCNRQSYLNSEHEKTSRHSSAHICNGCFFRLWGIGKCHLRPKNMDPSMIRRRQPVLSRKSAPGQFPDFLSGRMRYAVVALSHDFQWSPMVFGTSRNPGEFRTCHFMSFHVTSTCCKFISPGLSASNFSLRQNELFGVHDVQDLHWEWIDKHRRKILVWYPPAVMIIMIIIDTLSLIHLLVLIMILWS